MAPGRSARSSLTGSIVHVPFRMRRDCSTLGTSGDFPLISAYRAESASVECVPLMPAVAGPKVFSARRPLALGTAGAGQDRAYYLVEFDGSKHPRFRSVLSGQAAELRQAREGG